MNQDYKDFLLDLDRYRNKTVYARITALTFDELPREYIEGRVTQGSINLDGASALRRSCSLTMVANEFDYSDYMWGLNTKFKLEIGLENVINPNYPPIVWFNQGIYLISLFNTSRSASNFTISLQGKDKMCLLNGEVGGSLNASVDFGQIEEEDMNGNWKITPIPIPEIIRNAVHTYANEPYHNIIINDLETYGLELLEYRYDTPMYLWRAIGSSIYDNAMLEHKEKRYYLSATATTPVALEEIPSSHLDLLVETLVGQEDPQPVYVESNGVRTPYIFAKVEYGQTAGYRKTDLTYPGDLIGNIGESITSILDKIKNMLVEFEYFYDVNGQFIFQKKQSFISTMWSPSSIILQNELEITRNALALLRPDMTKSQYEIYENASGINWGGYDPKLKETIITFAVFCSWTYDQQYEYLNELISKYEVALYSDASMIEIPEQLAVASSHAYNFKGSELITAFNNNPNLLNLRNDYSIWGERTGVSGAKIPVHLRYAIDEKPSYYKAFDGKIYMSDKSALEDLKNAEKEKIKNAFYDRIKAFKLAYEVPTELPAPRQENDGSWSEGWWDIRDWCTYYTLLTDEIPSYTMKWYSRNDTAGCVPASSLPITYTNSSLGSDNYVWLLIRNRDGRYNAQHGSGNPDRGATTCYLWESHYDESARDGFVTNRVYGEDGKQITKKFIPPYSGCSDTHTYLEFLERDVKINNTTVYFYNPSFPSYDSYEDAIMDKIDKEYEEYEKLGILNYVDWREIIYQMAKDYYKHNTRDDFEIQVGLNNKAFYPTGRTGYEIYYIDIQGFWRQLYYPQASSDWEEKKTQFTVLDAEVKALTEYVYGKEVDYSDNNLGGLENDLAALKNILAEDTEASYAKATSLVRYWNTGVADSNITNDLLSGEFAIPRYDFRDEDNNLINEPSLYASYLDNWYYQKKSELETKSVQLADLKIKVEKLEKDATQNYYMDVSDGDVRKYWNRSVYESPEVLNFWFDFLDARENSALGKYSVRNIGARTKSINDTNVKSIYFRETPGVIFSSALQEGNITGYRCIQVPNIDTMFTISAQGKSAKERLDELLYQHSYCVESATITAIPIYYLQPNTRIYVFDEETKLNGDYIISKITIPLAYNGTMQLTTTKAAENII